MSLFVSSLPTTFTTYMSVALNVCFCIIVCGRERKRQTRTEERRPRTELLVPVSCDSFEFLAKVLSFMETQVNGMGGGTESVYVCRKSEGARENIMLQG